MLVEFKSEIQKQSLPKWTDCVFLCVCVSVCEGCYDEPICPGSPNRQHSPILHSSTCNAVISMETTVGFLMKFSYLQEKGWRPRIHWTYWCCLSVPAPSMHHMIGIQCLLLPLSSKSSMHLVMINGLYL